MKPNFPNRRFLFWLGLSLIIVLLGFIPVRINIAFHQTPTPQAIFVLGGNFERTKFAGKFWQSRRDLDIWVSDYRWNLDVNRRIFHKAGIPDERLHFDFEATDTVTNFTTLVDNFVDDNLQHIYLITSDYHMRRARVIATVVLGSRGVVVSPVVVASGRDEDESLVRVVRDFGRSLLWVVSGRTGASFNPRLRKSHLLLSK
ncbi:YdcF family protein [Rivularia sp. UHCC 0363]|uniref:YdcF family protein n=1 Tax=Rivularia sp. UHCC 0363 TaxID=3110244 RepID=UPI002B1FAEB1|nr:YdcF family protein [Rivularia sp. UHCC 0363]MEA5598785.1 YdcF family protein [Rivularia sp. UHCC 0363]